MKIAYYPGCTLKNKAQNLEAPAIKVLAEFGIEMVELDRWNCCGAVYSLADDDLVHQLAPVRNLIRAKEQGFDKVVTLCSMCYNTLARANLLIQNDEVKRDTLNSFMEEEVDYAGEVKVMHLLSLIRDEIGWENFAAKVKRPLTGLKIAPYYGCTLTRPNVVSIDESAIPTVFEDFIRAIGAETARYGAETECCGSYQIVSNPDASYKATARIIGLAGKQSIDALALSCPLCEYSLGKRQKDAAQAMSFNQIPVIYFTQLMGLAMGLPIEDCRFDLNPPEVRAWLAEKGLIEAVAV